VVSYGNALDVNESELMDYFSRDPETEIIAAYIESVKDGKRFMRSMAETAVKSRSLSTSEADPSQAGGRTTVIWQV
jgi:acyl-CoA synthetase (NDP forming)